jgi:hypothetical protein
MSSHHDEPSKFKQSAVGGFMLLLVMGALIALVQGPWYIAVLPAGLAFWVGKHNMETIKAIFDGGYYGDEEDEDEDEETEENKPTAASSSTAPEVDLAFGKQLAHVANRFGSTATALAEAWSVFGQDPERFIELFNKLSPSARIELVGYLNRVFESMGVFIGFLQMPPQDAHASSDNLTSGNASSDTSDNASSTGTVPLPDNTTTHHLPGTVRRTVPRPGDTNTFVVKNLKGTDPTQGTNPGTN